MNESIRAVPINNTKLVNKLKEKRNDFQPDVNYRIYTGKGKTGAPVFFTLCGMEDVSLSYIDFLILDIAQLFFEWPLSEKYGGRFTLRKFIRIMTSGGIGDEVQISPKRLSFIRSRIDRLSKIKIRIDLTEENEHLKKKYGNSPHPTGIIEDALLPVRYDEEKREYCFVSDILPLYEYASVSRQIIRVPQELFFCGGTVSNTDANLMLKYYLIHKIEIMLYRNGTEKNFSDNRLYYYRSDKEGLLPLIGYTRAEHSAERGKKFVTSPKVLNKIKSVHDTVTRLLDYYKKMGLIKDYQPITLFENGAAKGVEIVLM